MAKPTNEQLHSDIKLVKQDVEYMRANQARMQEDLSMIKKTLLGPDNGTIARVNKNTQFRKSTGKSFAFFMAKETFSSNSAIPHHEKPEF